MNSFYLNIFNSFSPRMLPIPKWGELTTAHKHTNLLLCGEIHGIQQNASVVYTLCHKLSISRIGLECSSQIKPFVDSAITGSPDFNLIDPDTFESSVLSIEMAKAITLLVKEGVVNDIVYLDTYFENPIEDSENPSPSLREDLLAKHILNLGLTVPTLCILGQWHTQPTPIQKNDSHGMHYSALYRIRQQCPEVTFLHNLYREGNLYNSGRTITIPYNQSLSSDYRLYRVGNFDFDLHIPMADKIILS